MSESIRAIHAKLKEKGIPVKSKVLVVFNSNTEKMPEACGKQNGEFYSTDEGVEVHFDVGNIKDEINVPLCLLDAVLYIGRGILDIFPESKDYKMKDISKRHLKKVRETMEKEFGYQVLPGMY